jgi:hypothetical protein
MSKRPGQLPFTGLFRKLVPDLSGPDRQGWASGTCPYCHHPGSFRANLHTGAWVCIPTPKPEISRDQVGNGRGLGVIPSLSVVEGT